MLQKLFLAMIAIVAVGCAQPTSTSVGTDHPANPDAQAAPLTAPNTLHASAPSPPPTHIATTQPLYVCPMHPEVTSDKPGQCPKCGMTLVKRQS
jgi:hypothetical protein